MPKYAHIRRAALLSRGAEATGAQSSRAAHPVAAVVEEGAQRPAPETAPSSGLVEDAYPDQISFHVPFVVSRPEGIFRLEPFQSLLSEITHHPDR